MTTPTHLKIACSSFAMPNFDKKNNWESAREQVLAAAKEGAQCICLPELHATPYFCQQESKEYFDLAETIPGPTTDFFSRLAKEQKIVIIASVFEKRLEGLFHNTAVVIDSDGSIAGTYRKMHIPDDPGFSEKFYFTPGDMGFNPIQTSIGKLGVLVCWDQWFPEAARLMALKGADMLFYPTAIAWDKSETEDENKRQLDAWLTIQRAHAIANHLPVIISNRVGQEDNLAFWGNSHIFGPQGEALAAMDETNAGVRVAEIDLALTTSLRRIWPYFRDRRVDAYEDLLQLASAK